LVTRAEADLLFIRRSSRSRRRWHATLALWIENWLICSEFARQQSNTWTVEHVEFAATLKSGKETADERVERSLYHKAVGYRHDVVRVFCTRDGTIVEHAFVEHLPPSDTACILWLKNLRPDKWRDRAGSFSAEIKELFEFTLKLVRPQVDALIQRVPRGFYLPKNPRASI
jgi:hypothetical protein